MWVHYKALKNRIPVMRKDEIPPIPDFGRRVILFLPLIVIVVCMIIGFTAIFSNSRENIVQAITAMKNALSELK